MYRFLFVYFGVILGIKHIEGNNAITTVYKFQTIKSYTAGVKYLNTCRVEVHVEDNPLQLPLFNINGNSSLPESTIPPLYTEQGTSTWTLVMKNGTTRALPAISLTKTDFSQAFDTDLSFNTQIMKLYEDNIVAQKSVTNEAYIFENLEKNGRTILEVKFQDLTPIRVYFHWRCSYSDYNGTSITFMHANRRIEVCYFNKTWPIWTLSHCSFSPQNYAADNNGRCHVEIDLTNNITIVDQVSLVTYKSPIQAIQGCKGYSIIQFYDNDDRRGNEVSYTLKQRNEITLISPWADIKHHQTLFILHSRQTGSNLSVLVEDANPNGTPIQLPYEEITRVNKTDDGSEVVLTKVNVTFPLNWVGQKRIKIKGSLSILNVWEGRPVDLYRIQEPQPCLKSNTSDIYNTKPLRVKSQVETQVSHCFNGGRLENNSNCNCPPGFVGNACEIPCGRNLFGTSCMEQCSESSNECRGMVLCTPEYGCSCAPGYQGNYCSEQCQPGFYGADCKQQCGDCRDGCDIYTGTCHGGCHTTYLTRPQCKHAHSYLLSSGQVLNSSFDQIKLQIDFTRNNLFKSNDNTMFYMMQYRENKDSTWINSTYELFDEGVRNITLEGLKPGRIYQIRTLLIDEAFETHDPLLTKPTEGHTTCTVLYKGNLQTSNITNTSVTVAWNEGNDLEPTECPRMGYILEISEIENVYADKENILLNEENSYTVDNLNPGRTYQINLKKLTVDGESVPIFGTKVTTTDILDLSKDIVGVTLLKTKSSIDIKWFPSPTYKTFFIKYKLKRHLACRNREETVFPLQLITTSQTSYSLELNDLEANAQYELFVTADINQNTNPYNKSFITLSRVPTAIPTLLDDKLKISNESAQLHWTDASVSCQHMNGIFKSYGIDLYNKQNLSKHVYITPDDHLTITGLTPDTKYDVRIRFVNQVGPSSLYLEHSFQTKQTSVFFIQDLTAYKTGPDLIGLRWKCVHNNLTNSGINIHLQTVIWNKTITFDFGAFPCKAWPGFMCFDVTELMSNTKYTIKMETFPEGSESKTIQAVTKENAPSPVSDIQADCTNTSMTVSWRIPNLLNGILRNFVIELEHLSSYDETMCCQDLLVVNYTVSTEEETYSYTLQNIKPASSYQISIRPFTKRWGSITSHFIDTPPLPIPLRMKPEFKLDNVNIQFKEEDQKTSDSGKNELISETLVIVQEFNEDANVNTRHVSDRFTTDMSRVLASNTWWLTHVCAANDDKCSVDLNVNEYQNSTVVPYYGQVVRKPLERNHRYRIVVAQVNKYLSARSYTMKTSEYFTVE
uniref:Tyrosine-protein kinase receptor Tie-1 n=1 Tax=Cacopsylla melanoneura TaxID=428564 RepID=A0A8D8LLT9_9HEMI